MLKVTAATATQYKPDLWAIEASTLGLKPGQWPDSIATALGNGQDFVREDMVVDIDGDLVAVSYRQASSTLKLKVYND